MGIRGFERRLERLVEGTFARAFKSGLRPVELGRRLVREMDDNRSVGVRGGTVVPNAFTVALSASDLEQFEGVQDSLVRELGEAAREHARDEGYSFMGPVEVDLLVDAPARSAAPGSLGGRWGSVGSNVDWSASSRGPSRGPSRAGCDRSSSGDASCGRWTTTAR